MYLIIMTHISRIPVYLSELVAYINNMCLARVMITSISDILSYIYL